MKYPKRFCPELLAALAIAVCTAVSQAGIITSAADPALTGAVVDGFSSYAVGSPASVSDGFFTMTQNGGGALTVTDGFSGSYGAVGRSVVSWGGNGITINFAAPVTAMGIHIGGSDYSWNVFAYDGGLLGSGSVSSQVFGFYLGWADVTGISSVSFSPSNTDAVLFDNLQYVTAGVPEEGTTVALLGVVLLGVAAFRRRLGGNAA
jgi:hypothetical protein